MNSQKIYKMRREIETTFGELKYAIGLNTFHARKRELIKQEIGPVRSSRINSRKI